MGALTHARISVNRGRLILKEEHYLELSTLLHEFEKYHIGKSRLIDLRSDDALDEIYRDFHENDIREQIQENRNLRDRYQKALDNVLNAFKDELGLSA